MARSELTVLEGGLERARRPRRALALALYLALAATALLSTSRGAGRAQRPPNAKEIGAAGERAAAARGPNDPEVRAVLRELRRHLGERPLDAAARLAYAGVLREAAAGADGIDAAVFHAERAVAIAPVTTGFAGTAARILARSGQPERAAEIARGMFSWAPWAAAEVLRDIEPYLGDGAAERVVVAEPTARRAWIVTLRNLGRVAEADAVTEQALREAPGDTNLIEIAARSAIAAGNYAKVDTLIPPGPLTVRGADAAMLLALRAQSKAYRGDRGGAIDDAHAAITYGASTPLPLVAAGDALSVAGDLDGARDVWQRARFALPPGEHWRPLRVDLTVRLAQLEERAGRNGEALRTWREVLELDPTHPEGLRRSAALRGGS